MTLAGVNFPKEWKLCPLTDVAEIRLSNVDKKVAPNETPVLLCNYMDVYGNEYIHGRLDFSEGSATEMEISKFSLSLGDVVITKDSETQEDIAKAALVSEEIPGLVCGYHLAIIRASRRFLIGEYLKECVQLPHVRAQFIKKANGVTRYGLTQATIHEALVPLPPLPEQRKIAEILGMWDEAIRLTADLIAAKQQRKKGLMQRLLTGAVRFPGFEGRPWRRRTLQELLQIDYGKSPNGVRDDEGIFPIYGTGGIVGSSNQALCDKPAIIVGRKGTINKPQLAVTPFWAIDTTYYCVPRSHVDVAWAYYTLNHMALEKYNEASGVPSLLRTTLYSIYVEVPELYEQQKIAAVLRACDDEIDLLQQKLAALEQQKKGLMQRLLTGQVRVKV